MANRQQAAIELELQKAFLGRMQQALQAAATAAARSRCWRGPSGGG